MCSSDLSRPDEAAAKEIFSKYLTDSLPIDPEAVEKAGSAKEACLVMIADLIKKMYSTGDENKFLEVTYAKGEREIFYFKDFSSGAMIQNIVARAKRKAVKRAIRSEEHTSELQSRRNLVCRLLLEKKKKQPTPPNH